tara:strand:- start:436 stop:714 length:279 start_codon:yes stop_codon:yes gene_type:complete
MRITIDTKEDSYDDIKKVLHVLNHLIENKSTPISSNYEPKETVDTTNMMNMFGSTTEKAPDEATAPDFSSFLNLAEKKEEEKKDDLPQVELF